MVKIIRSKKFGQKKFNYILICPDLTCLNLTCPDLTCLELNSPDLTFPDLTYPDLTGFKRCLVCQILCPKNARPQIESPKTFLEIFRNLLCTLIHPHQSDTFQTPLRQGSTKLVFVVSRIPDKLLMVRQMTLKITIKEVDPNP